MLRVVPICTMKSCSPVRLSRDCHGDQAPSTSDVELQLSPLIAERVLLLEMKGCFCSSAAPFISISLSRSSRNESSSAT